MHLTVQRHTLTARSTISVLSIDGIPTCSILEDPVRLTGPKVWGDTAIPAGTYGVIVNQSTRFSAKAGHPVFLPLLLNVPGYEGVRIHCGNSPVDTEGCLLVGVYSKLQPDWVSTSQVTFGKVFPLIQAALNRGEAVTLTIS